MVRSPAESSEFGLLCENAWRLMLLVAAAVVADWYGPAIFAGHSLVLGLVFYWVALRVHRAECAALVLITSMTTLTIKWSQPYSAGLVALEGVAVGWAWRRGRNPLLASVTYWLVIGTPVSWFLYRHVYPIPWPSFEYALIVQPVNGLLAVWLAYLVLELITMAGGAGGSRPQDSFRTVLLRRYMAFGTLPVLVVGLLAARSFEERTMSEAKEDLKVRAQHKAGLISAHVNRGSAIVLQAAARQVDRERFSDRARLTRELNAVHRNTGAFITMLAADATGRILGAAPESVVARSREDGRWPSVEDREYFVVPMSTGQPHVSGVFRGRGFGRDLLIGISAPVIADNGERLGVVEGSMQVSVLAAVLRIDEIAHAGRSLLCDSRQQVITANDFDYAPLTSLAGSPLGRVMTSKLNSPARFTADVGTERVVFLSVTVPVPGLDWTLTVQRPWSDILGPVLEAYGWTLLVILATVLVAFYFTSWSLRSLLDAWRVLVDFAHAPKVQSGLLAQSIRPDLPQEFRDLLVNLSHMADRLEVEQNKREELLAELEVRVKQRTQELERALVLAQSADRAKSAFLATISHELRTPLTAILTGLRLLKLGGVDKTEPAARTLGTMERAGHVLMSVITDVLDYSRLEAGGIKIARQSFRPAEVITDVSAIIEPAARKANLELCVASGLSPDLEWIGDIQRVRQVLLNLAGNAAKFTGEGFIEISSWVEEEPAGPARRLWFSVEDSGPGIPPERLASIFEPFVQLETNRVVSQAGTGLGLSISRRLVEMMGGQILAASSPGEGSVFTFWISAAGAPNSPDTPAS